MRACEDEREREMVNAGRLCGGVCVANQLQGLFSSACSKPHSPLCELIIRCVRWQTSPPISSSYILTPTYRNKEIFEQATKPQYRRISNRK
jgi:hypothetical protein